MREKAAISGVTHTLDEAVYEVDGIRPAELFEALAKAEVNVDTAAQIGSETVFSAPLADRVATAAVLDRLGATWSERDHLAKISVAGTGLNSHSEIAARTFATLRGLRVEPQFVSTSPVEIAFYVPQTEVGRVARMLQEILGLAGKKPEAGRA